MIVVNALIGAMWCKASCAISLPTVRKSITLEMCITPHLDTHALLLQIPNMWSSVLEIFIGIIIIFYFGFLQHFDFIKVLIILLFSIVGIAGSYAVAWFGIRVNTFANSRTSFSALRGNPFPCYAIPLQAGISIGMLLISVELLLMLFILLFIPGDYAGSCFIGFAIGESLGAAALRVAGGIFTKIADIGADLMKIVFPIKEDDARNPGVIADCTGDNAGDSVGPSADVFETYGVTGVALISFILLAVRNPLVQVQLLPTLKDFRLALRQAGAHRKIGLRQEQRLAVVPLAGFGLVIHGVRSRRAV